MHEYAIVDQLLEELQNKNVSQKNTPNRVIRLRYGPGLSEKSLRHAFSVQSAGTPLEGLRLELERKAISFHCLCGSPFQLQESGHDPSEEHDHDHDPYWVCPQCQHVSPIPDYNLLEWIHGA